jgi:hypothetical protein
MYGMKAKLIGKNWADRFLECHRDRLKTFWGRGLNAVRTNALNPASLSGWFTEVLGLNIEGVDKGLISGMDETGCPLEDGCTVRVVGGREAKSQSIKRAANRQNITVLVCICADGTYTRPHVIFKGAALSSNWGKNNISGAMSVI